MVEFKNKIVQLGFGAVGKSFFEKAHQEIKYNPENYFVISENKSEHVDFVVLGGKVENFVAIKINENNYQHIFSKFLSEGDFLIDFADSVGTKNFVEWCANNNVMYLNTGETDWEDNWYNIFDENIKKNNLRAQLKENSNINKYPIVLQHGNNPGLVSHFVKAGLTYIVKEQFKNNMFFNKLLEENKFNELAKALDIKEIHVNDNDYQEVNDKFDEDKLYSSWSIDSFFFEMLSEATAIIGTAEKIDHENKYKMLDIKNGFLEFKNLAIDTMGKTYYPKGKFEGFLVPHEETITIAKFLEVKHGESIVYRPTVVFLYSPCNFAIKYLKSARVTEDVNFIANQDKANCFTDPLIVRGFKYPQDSEIFYKEKIKHGTEYVGVLLLGSKFDPVWIGNRIKKNFLYKDKSLSYWQTPTITPVAMSALAASCWMIKNKSKGGIYFPEDINEYNYIINLAEKYISKTIYKTFKKKKVEKKLNINMNSLQLNDILT